MKRYILIITFMFTTALQHLNAQVTTAFSENFDGTVSMTSSGSPGWSVNSTYYVSSANGYRGQFTSTPVTLESPSFSTSSNPYVYLSFDHICKLDFFDQATIEVYDGTSWTQLTGSQYTGSSSFPTVNYFASHCYLNWDAGNNTTVPNNTWWHSESFDISSIAGNKSTVKIRFVLTDGGVAGMESNYGWLLDNVVVLKSTCAVTAPPSINMSSNSLVNTVYNTGPFADTVYVNDPDGIDHVEAWVSVNGGAFTNSGTVTAGSTSTMYIYNLPSATIGDEICFYIKAFDATCALVFSSSAVHCFTVGDGISIPDCENFDATAKWTAQNIAGSPWQWGLPSFGATNNAHSGSKAWDIDLGNGYVPGTESYVMSPVYDFSLTSGPFLDFWYNASFNNGSINKDGVQLQYTLDATGIGPWVTIGRAGAGFPMLTDVFGTNWYNSSYISAFAQGDNPEGWSGNSGGWKNAKYYLVSIPELRGAACVRFRFAFKSTQAGDGFSFDDFCVTESTGKDLGIQAIVTPVGQQIINQQFDITGRVYNYGINDQFFNLKVIVDGNPSYIDSIELNAGEVRELISIPETILSGTHNLTMEVHPLGGDINTANNVANNTYTGISATPLEQGSALVTVYDENNEYKLIAFDLRSPDQNGAAHYTNWEPSKKFLNLTDWKNLGPVFGITSMEVYEPTLGGNMLYIYVASSYINSDMSSAVPPKIYKIDGVSGAIISSVTLPSGGSYGNWGCGNICANPALKQLYVTNIFDGKIYRLNANLGIIDSYDPFVPFQGISPVEYLVSYSYGNFQNAMSFMYGDLVYGIGFDKNRLYFSRWNEDVYLHRETNGYYSNLANNEIWSIAINPANGSFVGTPQGEISIPSLPGVNYSNPVSDIAFNEKGEMLLAESAHLRALERVRQSTRVLRYGYLPFNQGSTYVNDNNGNPVLINSPGWYLHPSTYPLSSYNRQESNYYDDLFVPGANSAGGVAWSLDGNICATALDVLPHMQSENLYLDGVSIIPNSGVDVEEADAKNYYAGVYPNTVKEFSFSVGVGDIYIIPRSGPCASFEAFTVEPDTINEDSCNCFTFHPNFTPVQSNINVSITVFNSTWNYSLPSSNHTFKHCFTGFNAHFIPVTFSYSNNLGCSLDTTIIIMPCPAPPPCESCIGEFAPEPAKEYLISAWTKEKDSHNNLYQKLTYDYPEIYIDYLAANNSVITSEGPFKASGTIIDGWQRIEQKFTVHASTSRCRIRLSSASGSVLFDDIRVFPVDGALKTFAYDPVTLKLAAELDERNYATFYEYDEEGKLSRIKKETERGIMTIQETKANQPKRNVPVPAP